MNITIRLLLLLHMVIGVLLITFGCSQKDDVIQPMTMATIALEPHQLPTLDTLYAYELWMVAMDGGDSGYTSLGKFLWNNYWNRFTDLDGNVITGSYEVPKPWYGYDRIMVTIENRDDPDPGNPSGTIIVVDDVVDPVRRPIKMNFPGYMFEALGYYFVGTPTNDTVVSDALDDVDDSRGVWLCSRAQRPWPVQDTLGIDSFTVEMTEPIASRKYEPDAIGIAGWVLQDSVMVVMGYDTIFDHRRIEITYIDTVDTNHDYRIDIYATTTPIVERQYFEYLGPMENLPDIKPYGWRYSAWVLLDPAYNGTMDLSRMMPFGYDGQWRWTGDTMWVVLPLGGFYRPDSADLSNPHISNREVPNFPGEDFVAGSDSARYISLNLRQPVAGFWGSIVVGMEPNPANIMIDPDRNFPLVFMADSLRSGLNLMEARSPHPLHNWSQFLPTIRVYVVFHQ